MNNKKLRWWWCKCYRNSIDDNYPDDEEDEAVNLQRTEETQEPSDEEQINQFKSDDKQIRETNNTDESNDDTDAERRTRKCP